MSRKQQDKNCQLKHETAQIPERKVLAESNVRVALNHCMYQLVSESLWHAAAELDLAPIPHTIQSDNCSIFVPGIGLSFNIAIQLDYYGH